MTNNTLVERLRQHDPLYRLLHQTLRLTPGQVAIGIAVLSGVTLTVELLLAQMEFQRLVFVVAAQALVIFPLAVVFYSVTPGFLAKPFDVLEKRIGSSAGEETGTYQEFYEKMISAVGSRLWLVLAILAVGGYWAYRLLANVPSDASQAVPVEYRLPIRLALLVIYSPLIYMGLVTFGRVLVGLVYISRFFQSFRLKVNPIDSDGAGGVAFVGQMLVSSGLIATAFGVGGASLVYVTLAAGDQPLGRVEVILLGLIYLILTPLVFYSLLWSPHLALARAREDALKPISEEYQRVFSEGIPDGKQGDDAIKSRTDHLVQIRRQFKFVRDTFPLWPLQVGSFVGLFGASVVPGISTIFSGLLIDMVKNFIANQKIGGM